MSRALAPSDRSNAVFDSLIFWKKLSASLALMIRDVVAYESLNAHRIESIIFTESLSSGFTNASSFCDVHMLLP